LTKNNPTMAAKFEELKNTKPEESWKQKNVL
jgi:hypothetical protein